MTASVLERFWSKVRKTKNCWLWIGAKKPGGYGNFFVNGKFFIAHRFSYELHYGKLKRGEQALHRCDVRACVRPSHMFYGTAADNIAYMVAKGRQARGERTWKDRAPVDGERNPMAKLTWVIVRRIRALHSMGKKQSEIARDFDLDRTLVHYIVNGKTWKEKINAEA